MRHPFDLNISELESLSLTLANLSNEEAEKVSGGAEVTTLALGEEGGKYTTQAVGEEGGHLTSYVVGEEGGQGTTKAWFEQGGFCFW